MNPEYAIRKATLNDAHFIAEGIIAAEKSNSDKLSLCTLFNIPEPQIKKYIVNMLHEEIDGCEFSLSSFLIVEKGSSPCATVGGWIECFAEELQSKILRSNLIGFVFPKESIFFVQTKAHLVAPLQIEREKLTLQIEYVYVRPEHRGKNLADMLINEHQKNALVAFPQLKKIEVQVFKNNLSAIKLYERLGFVVDKTFSTSTPDIFNYLPYNEKIVMVKKIK